MFSKIPIDAGKLDKNTVNKSLLRVSIAAELDAIDLYEQAADATGDANIRKVMLDVAKEEKTHLGEFLTMLLAIDEEQKNELKEGREEVKDLTGVEG